MISARFTYGGGRFSRRYGGDVTEGAVSCVRDWRARPDWFPRGLKWLSDAAETPLLLYVPFFCNDTAYSRREGGGYDFVAESAARASGVPDAPSGAACPWPAHPSCNLSHAAPAPAAARGLFSSIFALGKAQGMLSFEHDFVGINAESYGWVSELGSASAWLGEMGEAARAARVPMQWCTEITIFCRVSRRV
jgi:hypothetical protein